MFFLNLICLVRHLEILVLSLHVRIPSSIEKSKNKNQFALSQRKNWIIAIQYDLKGKNNTLMRHSHGY